jgi:hypothetical protein
MRVLEKPPAALPVVLCLVAWIAAPGGRAGSPTRLDRDKGPGEVELGMTLRQVERLVGELEFTNRNSEGLKDYWQASVSFDVLGKRPGCAGYSFRDGKLVAMLFAFQKAELYDAIFKKAMERYGLPGLSTSKRRKFARWQGEQAVDLMMIGARWGCGETLVGYSVKGLDRSPAHIVDKR